LEKFNPEGVKEWKEKGWIYKISASKPDTKMKLPWSHIEERLKHDLKPNVLKLTMPVLFVVGENDTSCPPYQQRIFYDLVPGRKEIYIVEGAPHTFKESEHLKQLKEIFNNWLKILK
jgi:fermentation-respiration switch protein FrsA (DUF1100 family)